MHCVILESSLDVFMQGLLALTSFLILVVKRWFERPRRPVKVAAMDGSKQGGGFAVANIFNMYLSMKGMPGSISYANSDPCQLYFINVILDTTARVFITFCMFKFSLWCFDKLGWTDMKSGEYGNPPQVGRWFKQLWMWLLLVSISKVVMGALTYAFRDWLIPLSAWALAPLIQWNAAGEPGSLQSRSELFVVMLFTPFVMNTFQLVVQDNFLKALAALKKSCPPGGKGGPPPPMV